MTHKLFTMPLDAEFIIDRLYTEGHDAYIVGGCVRDMIHGTYPHDWDICTSATPEQVLKIFKDCKVIKTGLQHGTVTIMRNSDPYEVTTFRIDGEYTDGRHPDSVKFTADIKEDLARRDFTINAMAYNHYEGLIDPFGGWTDLENGIIRCVGDPNERFMEDGLRILRALRFSSVYGFAIEETTDKGARDKRQLLEKISAERIQAELVKLLKGRNVLNVLLQYPDIICTIIPEMTPCVGFDQHNRFHEYTVYDHIAHAVANYTGASTTIKMALLLHDIGKPQRYTEDERGGHFHGHAVPSRDIAEKVMERLKFDNRTKDAVVELVLYHDSVMDPTPKVIRRWLSKIGVDQMERLMLIRRADILAHAKGTQEARLRICDERDEILKQVIADGQCFKLKDLAVNGRDIMALGIPQGKAVGDVLRYLLNRVVDGEVPNESKSLIEDAKDYTSNIVTN